MGGGGASLFRYFTDSASLRIFAALCSGTPADHGGERLGEPTVFAYITANPPTAFKR